MVGVSRMVASVLCGSVSHRLSEVVVARSLCTGTLLWKFRSSVVAVNRFKSYFVVESQESVGETLLGVQYGVSVLRQG